MQVATHTSYQYDLGQNYGIQTITAPGAGSAAGPKNIRIYSISGWYRVPNHATQTVANVKVELVTSDATTSGTGTVLFSYAKNSPVSSTKVLYDGFHIPFHGGMLLANVIAGGSARSLGGVIKARLDGSGLDGTAPIEEPNLIVSYSFE